MSLAHALDFTRGAARRELPRLTGGGDLPSIGWASGAIAQPHLLEALAAEVKPSRRRKNMMSCLATGWLPWGHKWAARLTLLDGKYFLCSGHALTLKEAQLFIDAGLLESGPPGPSGDPTLVITPAGRDWLSWVW